MPSKSPVTQREVATLCGVHPSTVCLALNGSPSIPLDTRQRVLQAVETLGYRPNAAARNLVAMRTERRLVNRLPLAWINQETTPDFWHTHPDAQRLLQGARIRAEESGYYLDEIWTRQKGMTMRRVAHIVRSRGIEGALFPVYQTIDRAVFSPVWKDISTLALGDHRLGAWFDLVCPDYCHNLDITLAALRRQGFVRIGLVLERQDDETTHGLLRSRYLSHPATSDGFVPLPVFFSDHSTAEHLLRWYDAHQPEVIISRNAAITASLAALPHHPLVVQWDVAPDSSSIGVDMRSSLMAARAVDCLLRKMQRFERGAGGNTECHLIKGEWREAALGRAVA